MLAVGVSVAVGDGVGDRVTVAVGVRVAVAVFVGGRAVSVAVWVAVERTGFSDVMEHALNRAYKERQMRSRAILFFTGIVVF